MKTTVIAGLAGSLVIAGAASAAFTGWGANSYLVEDGGTTYSVLDLYATFDAPATVVNVFDMNIVSSQNFHHDDLDTAGGGAPSWSPTNFFNLPGFGNPAVDSFVLIGGAFGAGASNSTAFDPSFEGGTSTVTGGWFNGNPPNLNGATSAQGGFDNATWVGRFVIVATLGNETLSVDGKLTAGGEQAGSGVFSYAAIPAPGALALLGLAGLAGTRRRRA